MLNKQEKMLNDICKYRFAALETALYLDTHPNDTQTLERHNHYATELNRLINEYNTTYNDPLTMYDTAQDSWTYIDRWAVGNHCKCSCECGGDE